ncbi:MAG: capsular polysaccharide biosynthesis protein [Eubacteriaceae bacterium]|nr:capsular polysaccharide biosynthesis protein [Eubacteriaceae bacterium]
MVDFHSHILPDMDDGSPDELTSLEMLRESARQGIKTIAATSHFYADRTTPSLFLSKRENRAQRLFEACQGEQSELPEIRLGAEVSYFEGMSAAEELNDLCIEGTNLLLVEMPFCPWTKRMTGEIRLINDRRGLIPIIAHLDRYIPIEGKDLFRHFEDKEVLIQVNADGFIGKRTLKILLNMLKFGIIDVLGSDCHNMDSRRPDIMDAMDIIRKKLGVQAVEDLTAASERIITG